MIRGGFRVLLELLAEHAEHAEAPIPVAIETSQGLIRRRCERLATSCSRSTR